MEQNNQQEYILRIEGLHKRFGDTEILKGVNLTSARARPTLSAGPPAAAKAPLSTVSTDWRSPPRERSGSRMN